MSKGTRRGAATSAASLPCLESIPALVDLHLQSLPDRLAGGIFLSVLQVIDGILESWHVVEDMDMFPSGSHQVAAVGRILQADNGF